MSTNLEHQISLLINTIIDCSRFMIRDFNEILLLQSSKRGVNDFTSKCITRIKTRLTESLNESRPKYAVILPNDPVPSSEFYFVIEPLSGINNFKHGIPFFCSSIALYSSNKDTALGVIINNPVLKELFYSGQGLGAWSENYNDTVTPKSRLRVSPLSQEQFSINLNNPLLELGLLAAGRLDKVNSCENNLILKAAALLVKEAGGSISFNENGFEASNGSIKGR